MKINIIDNEGEKSEMYITYMKERNQKSYYIYEGEDEEIQNSLLQV